jgi:hypothetical protein
LDPGDPRLPLLQGGQTQEQEIGKRLLDIQLEGNGAWSKRTGVREQWNLPAD